MERTKYVLIAAAVIGIILSGCSANSGVPGKRTGFGDQRVYNTSGMQVSKVSSQMANTMYDTMAQNLKRDTKPTPNKYGFMQQQIVFPKVAVTSFVDTDTYENAGYLGRALGEFFIHELNRRGVPVFELKLRKGLNVTEDGEYLYTRDWKKMGAATGVSHVLSGTITRNNRGVVLVGRIDDLENHTVLASATGFIPYENLPYCYRTAEKNCRLSSVYSYADQHRILLDAQTRKLEAEARAKYEKKRQKVAGRYGGVTREDVHYQSGTGAAYGNDNFRYHPEASTVPATSQGNYNTDKRCGTGCATTVVYPADSYLDNNMLVRDIKDQSQYERVVHGDGSKNAIWE